MEQRFTVNTTIADRYGNVDALLALFAAKGAENMRALQGSNGSPSAPGSPPGIQTGELYDSVESDGPIVRADGGHAAYLEFGTYKMPARPSMLPACLAVVDDVPAIAAAWFEGAG